MQHKEQQKTSHFKFDRTANCHHLCSWTMPFSTKEVNSSWQQIPKTLNTHLFSPASYPLREKEGTENYYRGYASRHSSLTTSFPQKNTECWRKRPLEGILSISHSSRDTMMSRKLRGEGKISPSSFKNSMYSNWLCILFSLAVIFIKANMEVPDLLCNKTNPKTIQPLRQHILSDLGKKIFPKI